MKNNILKKISQQISNMEKLCKIIIFYGTLFSFCLFAFSAAVFYCNNIYINSYVLTNNCIAMMKTSVNIFAEIIIGALLMDNIMKANVG